MPDAAAPAAAPVDTDGDGVISMEEAMAHIESGAAYTRPPQQPTSEAVSEAAVPRRRRRQVKALAFANAGDLKHGLTAPFVERPFETLEEEMKDDNAFIKLPQNIYTVAFCSGFFVDTSHWAAAQKKAESMAARSMGILGAGFTRDQDRTCQLHVRGVGGEHASKDALLDIFSAFGDVESAVVHHSTEMDSTHNNSWAVVTMADQGGAQAALAEAHSLPTPLTVKRAGRRRAGSSNELAPMVAQPETAAAAGASDDADPDPGCCAVCCGFAKNWWLMFVNAFLLLFFHYILTGTVLWFMFVNASTSDPAPYDDTNFGTRWDSHFAQGSCPTSLVLRGICSSLFACFVYFDFVQSVHMLQWLYWITQGPVDDRPGWFFPQELKVLVTPSPFRHPGAHAEREIISRVPTGYRMFLGLLVVLPKMLIAICLLFFGGKLVLRSADNPSVIMNSLAAYFVAEMDEYVYMYLCPPAIQRVLEDEELFPPLKRQLSSVDEKADRAREQLMLERRERKLDKAIADFQKYDLNHDGFLNETELHEMLKALGLSLRRPDVRQLVLFCDKDGSGTVSIDELKWLLTKPPTYVPEDFKFSDAPDVRHWLQGEFQTATEDRCWDRPCCNMLLTLMPVVRILTIFLLTTILMSTYCNDFNPLDRFLRGKCDNFNCDGSSDEMTSNILGSIG